MSTSSIIIILVVVLLVMLGIWLLLLRTSRRVNLTRTLTGQKPEWIRSTPPLETVAATQADGEGKLYDYDKGENEAAAFAEQIEDILRSQLSADPFLHSYDDIDLGTGPDGGLEIRVGDKRYASLEQIPDLRLRAAITQAVATYNQRQV